MKLTTIIRRIQRGASVAALAAELGVSPQTIYARVRRSGRLVSELRTGDASAGRFALLAKWPGYRITRQGVVQTNWSKGRYSQPKSEGPWRDLAILSGPTNPAFVSLRTLERKQVRISLRTLLEEAFPGQGESLYAAYWRRQAKSSV